MKDKKKDKNQLLKDIAEKGIQAIKLKQVETQPVAVVPVPLKVEHTILHSWINVKGRYGFKDYLIDFGGHLSIIKDHFRALDKNQGKFMVLRGLQSRILYRNYGLVSFIKSPKIKNEYI